MRRLRKGFAVLLMIAILMPFFSVQGEASWFTPRMSAPSRTDYMFSGNPIAKAGYPMPNCTCYAYGRAWEILGKRPTGLSVGHARRWYNESRGFNRGQTPKLGAIACWGAGSTSATQYGHVAVVEKIYSNGNFTISESSYGGRYFDTKTGSTSTLYRSMPFQGFIYLGDYSLKPEGPIPPSGYSSITFVNHVNSDKREFCVRIFRRDAPGYALADDSGRLRFTNIDKGLNHIWKFYCGKNGTHNILNLGTNRCLDVYGGSEDKGARIQTFTPNGYRAQEWYLYGDKDSIILQPNCVKSMYVFDYYDPTSSTGAAHTWTYQKDNDNQRFKLQFVPIPPKDRKFKSYNKTFYSIISPLNESNMTYKAYGNKIKLGKLSNTKNQIWKFERRNDNSYLIRNLETNECIDLVNGEDKENTKVGMWKYNNTSAQEWKLYGALANMMLQPNCIISNRVLDYDNGAKISSFSGRDSQRFNIEEVNLREEREREVIKYSVQRKPDYTLSEGEEKVIQEGKDGYKEKKYGCYYLENKLIYKEDLGVSDTKKPVDKVIAFRPDPVVEEKIEEERIEIDFEEELIRDINLNIGEEKVIKDGIKGLKEITYKVTYKDGKIVNKQEIAQGIIRQPVNKVIAYNNLEPKYDLNNDNRINIRDVYLLRSFISGNLSDKDKEELSNKLDLNGDGRINIRDVYLIRNIIEN